MIRNFGTLGVVESSNTKGEYTVRDSKEVIIGKLKEVPDPPGTPRFQAMDLRGRNVARPFDTMREGVQRLVMDALPVPSPVAT